MANRHQNIIIRRLDLPTLWSFLAARNPHVAPRRYHDLVIQVAGGHAVVALVDDVPLLIGGLFPGVDGGPQVAWFDTTPAGLGNHPVTLARCMSRVIAADATGDVLTGVAPGHAPGERLARILGFEPLKFERFGWRWWRLRHGRHR